MLIGLKRKGDFGLEEEEKQPQSKRHRVFLLNPRKRKMTEPMEEEKIEEEEEETRHTKRPKLGSTFEIMQCPDEKQTAFEITLRGHRDIYEHIVESDRLWQPTEHKTLVQRPGQADFYRFLLFREMITRVYLLDASYVMLKAFALFGLIHFPALKWLVVEYESNACSNSLCEGIQLLRQVRPWASESSRVLRDGGRIYVRYTFNFHLPHTQT